MKQNMKTFFSILLLCIVPVAGAVDVDLGGQHRMRGVYVPQDDQENISDAFIQRFKFNGSFRSNEMFESHFWLMTSQKWGGEYNNSGVRIYGYGDWKVMDEVMVRVGRVPVQMTDGSLVGVNDYENYPYVWDGAFLTYNTSGVILDAWAAFLPKVWNRQEEVAKYNDAAGVSLSVRSLPEFFKTASVFVNYSTVEDGTKEMRAGVSVGGSYSPVDYSLSAAVHGDDFSTMENYFGGYELGYNMADMRVYVTGHYESEAYKPYYYTRHNSAGRLDVAAWGNGTSYHKLGWNYMPMDDLELGLAGLYFYSIGANGVWYKDSYNLAKEKVWEVDAHVKKSYAGGFAIELQAGAFDVQNEPHVQVQMNTTFDF